MLAIRKTRLLRTSTFLNVHSPFARWLASIVTIGGNAVVQAITLVIFARSFGPAEYSVIVIATASAMVAAELVGTRSR